jgi:hypothetical protein
MHAGVSAAYPELSENGIGSVSQNSQFPRKTKKEKNLFTNPRRKKAESNNSRKTRNSTCEHREPWSLRLKLPLARYIQRLLMRSHYSMHPRKAGNDEYSG